jgi:glycosyltransferase involved in cell wall biosynthesis
MTPTGETEASPRARILIIVPAWNEDQNLPPLLAELCGNPGSPDVCVIDDGSSDETARVAATYPGVRVVSLPINLGIGGAVQTGYLYARREDYDVAIQVDADGQHDPQSLPRVLGPVLSGEADLCIGSRFVERTGYRSTPLRRAGIRYLSVLLRWRAGVRVLDPTSGLRAAGRRAIRLFSDYYPSDFPEPESLAVAQRHGLRLKEVSVVMKPRASGMSSIDTWRSLYYFTKVSLAILLLPSRGLFEHGEGSHI